MNIARRFAPSALIGVAVLMAGCAAPIIDFSQIERPTRPAELEAYNVFEGQWNWEAEVVNAEGEDKTWTGEASWRWTLDNRWLHGLMSAKTKNAEFEAAGVWGWNPQKKHYVWWMFNNWGYPQEGTAKYDEANKAWSMNYTAVGLDGTTSYGWYWMKALDDDTLEWKMIEWADALHMAQKLEMTGTYKRK
ncbi:MAG TPA: hypothetical protein VM243_15460 [Phycisphaerae bacterium]|nr:hypothetical protein [Phycisphaerae bacterium]